MTNIGLILIVLGWAYQVLCLYKNDKKLQPIFVGSYAVGVLFLVMGSSVGDIPNFISLDGFSFILALFALVLVLRKN